jgi:pheromone a factor receptor
MKRRAQFSQFISSSTSLTVNRYFRLMALATVELLCTTPISAYAIYLNVTANPMQPWVGWSYVHYHFSEVGQFPAVEWRMSHLNVVSLELSRWSVVFCAFVFFGFFGFADEARKHYRMAYQAVAKRFGASPTSTSTSSSIGLVAVSFLLTLNVLTVCSSIFKRRAKSLPMDSVGSLPVYTPRAPLKSYRASISSSVTRSTEKKATSSVYDSPT